MEPSVFIVSLLWQAYPQDGNSKNSSKSRQSVRRNVRDNSTLYQYSCTNLTCCTDGRGVIFTNTITIRRILPWKFFVFFPCILIFLKFHFIHQLMHKWTALQTILKFTLKLTLKQFRNVSVHHTIIRERTIRVCFFFSVALRPNEGHGLLIFEVSRSHTMTHRRR
jgi:hypothetical protein